MKRKNLNLNVLLKDETDAVKQAAADILNKAGNQLTARVKENMTTVGIHDRTGDLRGSVKFQDATKENLKIVVKSEVFVKKTPKRPGLYNPAMKNRYKYGVPYGRLIEFSPRINKPFFYTAWYSLRNTIRNEVVDEIKKAWAKG